MSDMYLGTYALVRNEIMVGYLQAQHAILVNRRRVNSDENGTKVGTVCTAI